MFLSALPQHRRIYDTSGEICAPIFGSYFFISFLVEPPTCKNYLPISAQLDILSQKGWKLLNYHYESMSVKMAKMFGRWIKNRTHFPIAYCIHICTNSTIISVLHLDSSGLASWKNGQPLNSNQFPSWIPTEDMNVGAGKVHKNRLGANLNIWANYHLEHPRFHEGYCRWTKSEILLL